VIAGIIGGTGKMGSLFAGIFGRAGYEVMVSGRGTQVTGRQIAKTADIVIISVPIRSTSEVINSVVPLLSESQLICDLTSLKVFPVTDMLQSRAEVIGLHPMFGPSVRSINKQTIIVTPARCRDETLAKLKSVLLKEGAVLTMTTPENHDRMMAVVQGLTHFVTLSIAETMRQNGVRPEETIPFMSPVYQIETGLVGRLLSQDPELYADMLRMNPYVPPVIRACRNAVHDIIDAVESSDDQPFEELFRRDTEFFGDYCTYAAELTDSLIDSMVKR
jgi:prephenate dehydrogenase